MSCGKCGCGCGKKGKGLCPVSLGLALGITSALAVLIGSIWIMYYGMPAIMVANHIPMPTWSSSLLFTLIMLVKGFIFGFVLALFYDLFACCCKSKCCRSDEKCACGCECCGPKTKPMQMP